MTKYFFGLPRDSRTENWAAAAARAGQSPSPHSQLRKWGLMWQPPLGLMWQPPPELEKYGFRESSWLDYHQLDSGGGSEQNPGRSKSLLGRPTGFQL